MPTAVVTGAGSGIGRAVANRFARVGYHVIAADLDLQAARATAQAGTGQAVACDVSDDASVAALGDAVESVDVLVNNAGIWRSKTLQDSTRIEVDDVLATNVVGSWLVTQALAEKFPQEGGAIVNLTSVLAQLGGAGRGMYPASKAALIAMTKQMASEYAPRNIRVNAVGPGLILTEGTRGEFSDPGLQDAIGRAMPLGRIGEPQDVAAAVYFLASAEARYITGQVLFVDGGWTINGSTFIEMAIERHLEQLLDAHASSNEAPPTVVGRRERTL